MKKSCIKEELIYKSEIKKKNKREEKSCQRVGREPAYQKTLKYAVTERGETN